MSQHARCIPSPVSGVFVYAWNAICLAYGVKDSSGIRDGVQHLQGALFFALDSFSRELTGGRERLESFSLSNSTYHFLVHALDDPKGLEKRLTFILSVERGADGEKCEYLLRLVRDLFLESYGTVIKSLIRHWDGDIGRFSGFGEVIEACFRPETRILLDL